MSWATAEMENEDGKKLFEELYKKQYEVLYHLAFSIVKRPQIAEDVVQEAFTNLVEPEVFKRVKGMSEKEVHRFLYKITKNIALSTLKRQKREETLGMWSETYNIEEIIGNDGEMRELYDKLDLEGLIVTLKKLPLMYSMVIMMKYMKQLEDKEIADIHHITPSLVRKRLERARKKLKEQYKKDFFE